MRSAMIFFLCSAFLSCSFLSSSAAIFLSRVLSFFLRSGVMKPLFPPDFLALAASSRRLRTSAFLRSFSSIFLFSSSFSRLWASSASLLLRSVSDSSPMLPLAFWKV
uniref:Putative secreted protein n=1 Tax=Ixodes scapularis TaxID=6945 RepID=A0A4D5S109_IXOSC